MTSIFDTLSFDDNAIKPSVFDRVALQADTEPLDVFDRLTVTDFPTDYSPTAALQTSFTEYRQLKDKYPNLAPADINELMVRKKMEEEVGAREALRDIPTQKYIPGAKAIEIGDVSIALGKLEEFQAFKNDPIREFKRLGYSEEFITSPDFDPKAPGPSYYGEGIVDFNTGKTEKQQAIDTVEKYMQKIELDVAKEELLGLTMGAKISSGAAKTLPYILDFVVTHGVASGIKEGSIKLAERLLGKAVGKHVAIKAAATVTAAGVRTFAQPGTYDEYLKKILPHTKIDENGDLEVLQKGQAPLNAALETWAERTVGNLAEVSGSAIMGGAKKIVGKTLGKLPPGKLLMKAIEKVHKRIFPKALQREVAKKTFNAVGIQGLPEEWVEERFEGAMRAILGLPGGGLLPASAEEAITELGILGIFGGVRLASMMPFAFQPEAGSPQEAIKKLKNTKRLIEKSPEIDDSKKGEIQADLDKRIQQLGELAESTARERELEEHLRKIKGEQIEAPLTARPQITAEYQQRIDDLEEQRMVIRSADNLTEDQKEIEYEALDNEIFGINRLIQNEQKPIEQGDVAPTTSASRVDPEHVKRIEQELAFLRERRTEQQRLAKEEYDAIIMERTQSTAELVRNQARIGSEAIISEGQLLSTIEERVPEMTVVSEGQLLETPILSYRPGPSSTVPTTIEGPLSFKEPTLAGQAFTGMSYYNVILGTKELTKPAEEAKMELDIEYQKMSNEIDMWIARLNKEAGISRRERKRYYKKGEPTTAMVKMAEALNAYENPPVTFTETEVEIFRYFRGLSQALIRRENIVRDSLGMERIPYRTAYFRHIAERTAKEIDEGTVEIPQELRYWMTKQVTVKMFNPTEFKRKLSSKLEEHYSRNLGTVTKSMAWFALKEIHLSEPLRFYKEQLNLVSDIIPKTTRQNVEEFIKICIKGQETDYDKLVNNTITQTGFGKALNILLQPFAKRVSSRPMTNFGRKIGKLNLLFALWGRPKLIVRNIFQRMQNLGLFTLKSNLKGALPANAQIKSIMASSNFWRGYVGIEELDKSSLNKLERAGMMAYQWSAQSNAKNAMKVAYWDILDLITNKDYRNLKGWADPQRTYTEPKGFLYESELAIIKEEMEFGAGATQYQYLPLAMPGVFKHKTAVPLTRLQSWGMNYFFRFQREALLRMFTGKTSTGRELPWSRRIGWLRYTLWGCPIYQAMGYSSSMLLGVLPTTLAPAGALTWALYRWLLADDDREKKRYEKQIYRGVKTLVPGELAAEDWSAVWSGEKPPEALFLYGTQDEEGAWWSKD